MLQLAIKSGMESVIVSYGLCHAVAANKVSHGVFMGQIGREADIHHHLQHDLAQLPQFLDFLGFGGVIVAGYDLLLRVPKAIFLGNGDNLTNLIYVKVPPVP